MRLHHGNLFRDIVNYSGAVSSAKSTPKLFQAKICAKLYLKTFTKAEQSNQERRTEAIFCRKFLINFLSYLYVFYENEARYVVVCGCGDMGSSAVLSKLQMLFVAFMGQIPSSWLLKHSPARCWVFLIFILFRGDQIHFFLKFVLARN